MTTSTRRPAQLTVRRARPGDLEAAALLFDSARFEYARLAGSERRARVVLERVWPQPGHSASFEFAWVAEVGTELAGLLLGFPARDRLRLHASLVRRTLPSLPLTRWGFVIAGLARLAWLTPVVPGDAFYVAALAVAPTHRRRRIAWALGDAAQAHARRTGFRQAAAHTGGRHRVARAALEHYGLHAAAERRGGYVLYIKALDD